jgi:hypothetical protein
MELSYDEAVAFAYEQRPPACEDQRIRRVQAIRSGATEAQASL